MNLRNFISETLTQIMGGIEDAQQSGTEGTVNPEITSWKQDRIMLTENQEPAHMIGFDVAITISEGADTQGGAGLVVGPVILGSKGKTSSENQSYSRITFEIPVTFPNPKH